MSNSSSALSIIEICHKQDLEKESIQLPLSQPQEPFHFISRLTLVHSALKAYESSSSVVRYGAEMIESYAGPIYDKLGYDRKLKSESIDDEDTLAATTALARASLYDNQHQDVVHHRHTTRERKSRPTSRSTSPHRPYKLIRPEQQKSRWQQLVLNAGSAAGTTAAVISEESMKCLRYCLSWLQYAIRHIEQQMVLLRQHLASFIIPSSPNSKVIAMEDETIESSTLASIRREIIDTLRKVVDVVSRYAGAGLPEQAKANVRSFILDLPNRWAALDQKQIHPVHKEQSCHEASVRLLNFGNESIEMLGSVSTIFSDTIERAELWLKRLKVVSLHSTSDSHPTSSSPPKTSTDLE
ncbi:transcription factor Opi1-domain-containing protein [Blakeslea trispora]|nr:transcription factor Opi1-domain-containing protein [Blakeslea trispora]